MNRTVIDPVAASKLAKLRVEMDRAADALEAAQDEVKRLDDIYTAAVDRWATVHYQAYHQKDQA